MVARPDPDQVTHPLDVARQAVQVGGLVAIPGTIIGSIRGTLRTRTPVLFALASGAQCFLLGTTYWGARTCLLNPSGLTNWYQWTRGNPLSPRTDLAPSESDRVRASTLSGAFTAVSVGLLVRGPQNVIPGVIMFSLFGYAGQKAYFLLDGLNSAGVRRQQAEREREGEAGKGDENWLQRVAKSKWSPMKSLSDGEYADILQEKALGIEADIALIDERIAGLRARQRELDEQAKRVQEEVKK